MEQNLRSTFDKVNPYSGQEQDNPYGSRSRSWLGPALLAGVVAVAFAAGRLSGGPSPVAAQAGQTLQECLRQAGTDGLGTWLVRPDGDRLLPFPLPVLPEGQNTSAIVTGAIADGSPASRAGLRPGDVITAINGQPVTGPRALHEAVASRKPGEAMTLMVRRSGENDPREVRVTLSEHPERKGTAYLGASVGGYVHVERSANGTERREHSEFFNPSLREGITPSVRSFFDHLPEFARLPIERQEGSMM